jgi:hypothetical protein
MKLNYFTIRPIFTVTCKVWYLSLRGVNRFKNK